VRFHVLTAASMKMAAFWDIVSCSLVEVDRHFWGADCLHHLALMMETVRTYETSVYILESCRLHILLFNIPDFPPGFYWALHLLWESLATEWTTGRFRFEPRQRQESFPLTSVSRLALGPTQLPVQWVPGIKRGRVVPLTTHPYLVPRLWMSRSYTSSRLMRLHRCVVGLLFCFAVTPLISAYSIVHHYLVTFSAVM
jgi:hypothetical protein